MSIKNKVLELLEKNRGKNISGEQIAADLNVSRAAIWKAMKSLKNDGYSICAVRNRGYSLTDDNNILSVQGMLPYLSNDGYAGNIYIYKTLESTNKTAKEMAVNGCTHGTVIMADSQTAGKGRFGRSFYSPPASGLYMSLVLHSRLIDLQNITMITLITAVAVSKAIYTVTGIQTEIKWVNDILLGGKKLCGILTEAVTDFESGSIDWIVIGIGVNIDTQDFPNELNKTAVSINPGKNSGAIRNRLSAEIMNTLLSANEWMKNTDIIEEYKSRLTMLGKTVTVITANETYEAVAKDVDKNGNLIVIKENGQVIALSSGEVSVKYNK